MPADPKRVEVLFNRALALPPAERAALLTAECGDDAELRARVAQLLSAHAELGDLGSVLPPVDPPTATFGDSAADHSPTDNPGTVLAGRYKLIEQIGEGGMGAVWRAQQTDPVRRLVAVKLIKAGMDSRAVLARFEAERQALALMNHPNIAKVYDAGSTPDGRPFFVMELVKGVPLTKYCDEQHLTPRQRLELFVPVCQAIQHAHQKGIIHRDLKPSNVLMAMYDDRPVPKVIDFGVAKAAGEPLTDKTLVTGFGTVVGTPEYMSPEQANLNNLDVDTRSDVYALGVLLYELLTGTTPVSRKELEKAGLLDILRLIREQEPQKPSTKVSTAVALPTLSANRGTDPKRLPRLLRGELDLIVMKALEKDRARRYETANGLAADVRRYLAGESVLAVPPSAGYRLRKFLRRNRGALLAGSLVALALVTGVALSLWQAIRATRAERAIAEQLELTRQAEARAVEREGREKAARQEAERQKRTAEAINGFLQDVLRQGDSDRQLEMTGAVDPNLTLRQAIDRAAARIEGRFPNRPLVEADIRLTLGATYVGLGAYSAAEPYLRRSAALRCEHLGDLAPETLEAVRALARLFRKTDRYADAIALYRKLLPAHEQTFGPTDPKTLLVINQFASTCVADRQFALAEQLFLRHLEVTRAVYGADDARVGHSLAGLGMFYTPDPAPGLNDRADHVRAGRYLQEALTCLRKAHKGNPHPDLLDTLVALGKHVIREGRYDEAEAYLREALDGRRKYYGERHPVTLQVHRNLGEVMSSRGEAALANGDREEGCRLIETALADMRRTHGEQHWGTMLCLHESAMALIQYREATRAETLARSLVEALGKAAPDDWSLFYARGVLGWVLTAQKRYPEAEPLLVGGYEGLVKRQESVLRRSIFGPKIAEMNSWVVQLYTRWGKPDEAAKWRSPPAKALPSAPPPRPAVPRPSPP